MSIGGRSLNGKYQSASLPIPDWRINMNYTNENNAKESKIIKIREGTTLKRADSKKPVNNQLITEHDNSEEKIKKFLQEQEQELLDIISDPKRKLYEYYDVQDRERLKIGEFQQIYDPGFGKKRAIFHIRRFYGEDIFRKLKKEQKESLKNNRKENHVSPELYREIKIIYENKTSHINSKKKNSIKSKSKPVNNVKPKIKKQNLQRQKKPGDDYFQKKSRGLIRNKNYRELFKGPGIVYDWLWNGIARNGWKDTKDYPIKEKYFDNGFLAYSTSISEVARQCGMSKATAAKYLKRFEQAGVIEIDYLQPKGKKRGQSVFILGKWEKVGGKIIEIYYMDQVFLSE